MRHYTIFAVAIAAVILGLSACKMDTGDSSDGESSMLSTLADLEGYQYYKHENACNDFPSLCDDNSDAAILDDFNDPHGEIDKYGEESGVDLGGDSAVEAIGVDSDGDGVFDFVVADMDGDGIFDTTLVRDPKKEGKKNTKDKVCTLTPWLPICQKITKGDESDDCNCDTDDGSSAAAQQESEDSQEDEQIADDTLDGEEVWCGVNTLKDVNFDGKITDVETKPMRDGKINSKDVCNDPDYFCYYAPVSDTRCGYTEDVECVYNKKTGLCSYPGRAGVGNSLSLYPENY